MESVCKNFENDLLNVINSYVQIPIDVRYYIAKTVFTSLEIAFENYLRQEDKNIIQEEQKQEQEDINNDDNDDDVQINITDLPDGQTQYDFSGKNINKTFKKAMEVIAPGATIEDDNK